MNAEHAHRGASAAAHGRGARRRRSSPASANMRVPDRVRGRHRPRHQRRVPGHAGDRALLHRLPLHRGGRGRRRRARRGWSGSRRSPSTSSCARSCTQQGVELARARVVRAVRALQVHLRAVRGQRARSVDQWVEEIRAGQGAARRSSASRAAAAAHRPRVRPHPRHRRAGRHRDARSRSSSSSSCAATVSEGVAFDPIVASGPNSAVRTRGVTDRVIERGRLRQDGLRRARRRLLRGHDAHGRRRARRPTQQREIYDAVLAANEAGSRPCAPGVPGCEIDARRTRGARPRGLRREYFTHGLGHGVGLDVHEMPDASGRGAATRVRDRLGRHHRAGRVRPGLRRC